MLYNEEIKLRFIEGFSDKPARQAAAHDLFYATCKYEESWGADICTRCKEDVQSIVDDIVGIRSSSKRLRISLLHRYAEWCMANGVDGACDGILQVTDIGVSKMRKQMVVNPQHLQRFLDCICDKEDNRTVDCLYRAFYWLAYSGIREDDIMEITSDHIFWDEQVIRYQGREFPIYRESVRALKFASNSTEVLIFRPTSKRPMVKERVQGDTLLRISGDPLVDRHSLRNRTAERCTKQKYRNLFPEDDTSIDLRLSFYKVWLSGVFYRAYERERSGEQVDFSTEAMAHMAGKVYKLDSGRNLISAKQRSVERDFLEDYRRWKEAFSI